MDPRGPAMVAGPAARDPVGMTSTHTSQAPSLPATLRLGVVDLTVSDLDRALAFYADGLGLQLIRRTDDEAALAAAAAGEPLLVLHAEPAARRAGRHAGLYHVALLHSSRE